MDSWMVLYIAIVATVNVAVLVALLKCRSWRGVQALLALAIAGPLVTVVLAKLLQDNASVYAKALPLAIIFSVTGQILLFFMRNFILVKMRDVRARAFGQKIAPSQGFAKDFLLHIPQMRTEALIVFFMVTAFEIVMLTLPKIGLE